MSPSIASPVLAPQLEDSRTLACAPCQEAKCEHHDRLGDLGERDAYDPCKYTSNDLFSKSDCSSLLPLTTPSPMHGGFPSFRPPSKSFARPSFICHTRCPCCASWASG